MTTFQTPGLCNSGWFRPVAIMAGFAALAVLVRLPFLSDAGADEAFYLVIGRQWLDGMPPYAHSFDVKPPLLFALMAAAEAVFGPSLIAAKALTMAAVSAAMGCATSPADCARVASGQAATAPPIRRQNSRRFITSPSP